MNKHIIKLVGRNNVLDSDEDLEAYSIDASLLERRPALVVFPKKIKDIQKTINYCNRINIPLTLRGAGTNSTGSAIGTNNYIMDFSRMNKVIEFEYENKGKFIRLQPGIVVENLNRFLSNYKLMFPILTPEQSACTIGGVLALNKFGFRAFKYKRAINWISELEVLDGTGKHYNINNKEDFENFIGTEGCVGAIASAKLKLIKNIENFSMDIFEFEDIVQLITKWREIEKKEGLISLVLFDRISSVFLDLGEGYHLIAEYENNKGSIIEPLKMKKLKNKIEGVQNLLADKGYIYRDDPSLPIDQTYDLFKWLNTNEIPIAGSLNENTVHCFFNQEQKNLREEMYNLVKKHQGNVSSNYGYGILKKDYVPQDFKRKMMRLKEKYDYNNILNRGEVLDYK